MDVDKIIALLANTTPWSLGTHTGFEVGFCDCSTFVKFGNIVRNYLKQYEIELDM